MTMADVWDKPFTQQAVKEWKNQYGSGNIYSIEIKKDTYVVRGLGRLEFNELVSGDYRSEDEMEDAILSTGLLFPTVTVLELRNKKAGVTATLLEYITRASNIDAAKENSMEPVEMPPKLSDCPTIFKDKIEEVLKSKEITSEDINGWFARDKEIYMNIIEGKLFIYKSILRKEHEKFKTNIRDNGMPQFAAEEDLTKLSILYPLPGGFDPKSNKYLHGTISILSQLIYKASGFNVASNVVQL